MMIFHKKSHAQFVKIIIASLLYGSLGLFVLSCASKPSPRQDIITTTNTIDDPNKFEDLIAAIKKGQEAKRPPYPESNAISLFLDLGFLDYYAGNYTNSVQNLLEAEHLIEEAFTKSVTENIASYIVNDNMKNYAGEDFEDIYINVFNSLNFYKQGNLEGALVEVRKLTLPNGKLDMLNRKYEASHKSAGDWALRQLGSLGFTMNVALPQGDPVMFNNSALAHYLSGLFYLGQGNHDSARISFDAVHEAYIGNPKVYPYSVPVSVDETRDIPEGKARLNVIAFSGLSPIKEEGKFMQSWPFMQNIALMFPVFKLPQFIDRQSLGSNDMVEVTVNGEVFQLELLEDMGAVVKETYNAKFANIFFKTWIRVLLKYAAADIAATKAGERIGGTLLANVGALAARVAADATEGADIRMGQFLPNKAFVGGINLDPGSYTVAIRFASGTRYEHDIKVMEGALNLIDAFCLK
jgi:hypothetical protein